MPNTFEIESDASRLNAHVRTSQGRLDPSMPRSDYDYVEFTHEV